VVLRALAKHPDERFADADEFIAALASSAGLDATPTTRVVSPPPVVEPYETLDEREESSRRGLWWLAALLVLIALGLGAFLLLQPGQVTVPDVEGREVDAATRALERRGLTAEVREVESDDVPPGRVVEQSPPAGREVSEGSVVTLQVSSGPGQAAVPDVTGQSREEAEAALRDAGFEVRARPRYSDSVPEDEVIGTNPRAREQVTRGSRVTMIVSRGTQPVTVPDVTGLERDAAVEAIEEAGLSAAVSERETRDEEPEQVLEQNPAPGTERTPGARVAIVVAVEPPEVEVPDVVDLRIEEAIDELEELELEVRRRRADVSTPEEDGVVIDQDPAAGEEVPPGSGVVLTVGRFRPEDPAPGTENEAESEAEPTGPTR
jgi:beta-lactam-binding protein with PASTA domain